MATKETSTSKYLPLRPRARILRTLGEELISNENIAIIELVKNSYDADATRVLVRLIPPLSIGYGAVEIIDDGIAMSLDTVRTAWMEPATYIKKGKPRTEKLERRVLGDKGIGRFASSRLANELEIITREESSPTEVHGRFDWTQFDDEDKYLDEILIFTDERKPVEICPGGTIELLKKVRGNNIPLDLSKGTILRMKGLKRKWTPEHISDLERDLSRLVSPFKEHSDFSIALDLPEDLGKYSVEVSPPKIIKYPHYGIKGSMDSDGFYNFTISVHATGKDHILKGRFEHQHDFPEPIMVNGKIRDDSNKDHEHEEEGAPLCGPIEIDLRIWDRDELGNIEQATGSVIADIRRDLDSIAGINIYRDDFRVLPYGEPKNDWLRLDIRRVQKPTYRLSNNQIVGYISISADRNPNLRDQSNREGLDENQALGDLRTIILSILTQVESIRYPQRPRRAKKTEAPLSSLFEAIDLDAIRMHLTRVHPDDSKGMKVLEETEKVLDQHIEEIQVVLARYQRLATLGLLIDVILHDGRQPITKIVNETLHGIEDLEQANGKNGNLLTLIGKRLRLIENQIKVLTTVFRRLEPFGGRRRGRPTKLYLEKIIVDSFKVFQSEISKLAVHVSLPKTETLVRVDESEIQEVIVNLLQNSLYWLQQIKQNNRRISVRVRRVASDHLDIVFKDSGPGVEPEIREYIFEPYFSKKPSGIGLGLTIAGEIVSDYYGGKLELLDSGARGGAKFRITLRKRV